MDTSFSQWRKSTFSGEPDNECVEVSFNSNAVGLRDSKNTGGPVLAFNHGEWAAFLGDLR